MEKTFANDPRTRSSQGAMGPRHRRPVILAACVAVVLMLALGVSAGNGVHVSRVGGGAATAGRPWVVKLAVRPKSFHGTVRVVATGPRRLSAPARGGHGAYRARLVFPKPGVWRLTARAGGARSKLGSVRVRPAPLVLVEPTGIDVAPDGALLVVEFGRRRLVRIDPVTGRLAPLADLVKPWGVARAPSESIYVSDLGWVKRIEPGRVPQIVATVDPGVEVGPLTVTPAGDVVYSTVSAVYRLAHGTAGTPERLAAGTPFSGPHGIAVAADGSLLVSDTGNGLIRRIDPAGSVTTFAAIGGPRGIDVAPDGTVYVAGGDEHRIVHLDASGKRLGTVGPRFGDAYALSVARDGTVYAIDIGADVIRRLSPDGTSTVVGRH
jgi:streptogramin lyase